MKKYILSAASLLSLLGSLITPLQGISKAQEKEIVKLLTLPDNEDTFISHDTTWEDLSSEEKIHLIGSINPSYLQNLLEYSSPSFRIADKIIPYLSLNQVSALPESYLTRLNTAEIMLFAKAKNVLHFTPFQIQSIAFTHGPSLPASFISHLSTTQLKAWKTGLQMHFLMKKSIQKLKSAPKHKKSPKRRTKTS